MKYLVKVKWGTSPLNGHYWRALYDSTTPNKQEAYVYSVEELKEACPAKHGTVLIPVSEEEGDGGIQLNT